MTAKGYIDTKNVSTEQAFSWILEVINKAKEDALNIKDEEFQAVEQIVEKLKKKCNRYEEFYWYMLKNMTKSQQANYIKDVMDEKNREEIIKRYIEE